MYIKEKFIEKRIKTLILRKNNIEYAFAKTINFNWIIEYFYIIATQVLETCNLNLNKQIKFK